MSTEGGECHQESYQCDILKLLADCRVIGKHILEAYGEAGDIYQRQQVAYLVQDSFYREKKIDCNSRQSVLTLLSLPMEIFISCIFTIPIIYFQDYSFYCMLLLVLMSWSTSYFLLFHCKSGINLLDLCSVLWAQKHRVTSDLSLCNWEWY